MVCMKIFLFLSIFTFPLCLSIEPISTTTVGLIGGALSAAYGAWKYAECKVKECCGEPWVKLDYSGLQSSLKQSLHGQHLVEKIVARSIFGHMKNANPSKALVMAFHGWTGTGKNFASKLLAESIYKEGMKSRYVHFYIAPQHFPHQSLVDKYKDILMKEITEYTKQCGRSLFIFDETDKMPAGLIDALKPYLEYYEQIDGVDYRKNIFLFLSNSGGSEITRVAFDFWTNNKERESIGMTDIEPLINKGAFNEQGGLQHTDVIGKNLIDTYVPFFPLDKNHVKMCVRDIFHQKKLPIDEEVVTSIADQMEYYPPDFQLYSKSGCKKIAQKFDLYV